MHIAGVRLRLLELPLGAPFRPAWGRGRVRTDTGLTGLGAAHGGLEAAVTIDRFVTPHLLGQDPFQVERLAAVIRDAEILGAPAYGMEIPLWDLLGKAAGMPVCQLWGGGAARVRAYCATGELRGARERARDVAQLADGGFRAVKLRFHHDDPRDDLAVARAVRDQVGDRIELMVDANQAGADPGLSGHRAWDFRTALAVARELEDLGVSWLEEPLPRHDLSGLARLRDRLATLRLAGGEDSHGLGEFRLLLERECFDILQPDALKSETASAIRHLAAFAGLAGVAVIPHTWGSGISLLAHLHLAASLPNCGYLEFPHDPPSGFTAAARDQLLAEPLVIDDEGCVRVPPRPGFGFALDEERAERHTVRVIERGDSW